MFIDPVRLSQDIEATLQSGQSFYYELGQVIVPEVTVATINKILPLLIAEGYLDSHVPEREPEGIVAARQVTQRNATNVATGSLQDALTGVKTT